MSVCFDDGKIIVSADEKLLYLLEQKKKVEEERVRNKKYSVTSKENLHWDCVNTRVYIK